jgi:hypothetical protein
MLSLVGVQDRPGAAEGTLEKDERDGVDTET